jgi:hypothetical protein
MRPEAPQRTPFIYMKLSCQPRAAGIHRAGGAAAKLRRFEGRRPDWRISRQSRGVVSLGGGPHLAGGQTGFDKMDKD